MYRLYVDEVGHNQVKNFDHDRQKYLSLTGVAIEISHARDFLEPALNRIKADIFNHDPDTPICFHRKEIMGYKGPYKILGDTKTCEIFDNSILKVFSKTNYVVITALIDKQWMLSQYHWRNKDAYNILMEILAEKYAQFLERIDNSGDIMPEGRDTKSNNNLQEAFSEVMQNGTKYISADRMNYRIRARKLKFRTKQHNIAGLQLCDLLAHPSHIHVREKMGHNVSLGPFATKVVKILMEQKYDRNPTLNKVQGYGYKHFP